jgi:RNA polymerase sigma factor (sigma-70 family)
VSQDLVARARDGDQEAFSRLTGPALDGHFRTARLILRDDELADDAVQEAMLSAWLHIRAVRDPDRFGAWLRRLVIRACYRQSRSAWRRRAVEVVGIAFDPPAGDDLQHAMAVRDQLDRGFRHLSIEHRAALVVHHYLTLSDAEAAAALDVAIGTYKSRLHRATAAMRAALEADDRSPVLQESLR